MSKALTERQIVLVLASLSAITPLAIDMYLPSFPAIATDLHTSIPNVEFSLSLYFFGMAMGQLLGGPISDAYGRRPMVMIGLIVFGMSSLLLSITNQIEIFWILRALQSFGGGVATVNVSATVRDMFNGKESARIFSLIAMVMLMAPLLAPTLGALVLKFFEWEAIFLILGFYTLFALIFYLFRFPATKQIRTKITPIQNYKTVLSHKLAMVFIVSQILCTSGMYTFITSSSFVYMEHFHVSASRFSLFFGINVLMMMIFGRLNVWVVKRKDPLQLLRFGVIVQAIVGIMLFVLRDAGLFVIFPLVGLYVGILGFVFGNSVSLTLEFFPSISASANAIIGVLQYSVGALMGFIASSLHDGTLLPIMGVMMVVSLCGATLLLWGSRGYIPHHGG
ncbi:multidrug effflux MFS transporter [Sulfurospirillum diekertiae]|uniref:Multidrug effflux MFS transporter n=1 Tax=Sulfurospirillum diekertiae TaxID=1854492 RepID=A0A6G9VSZ2_9BACT|nr:multidrug effflux MFS transporter [Sulfurospirillum diekertiae]QIR76035.1 multidrug effflux MFS transporter [Sulfurospirillum diekertiae]QIR78676.1 multidrug effflux MFS transporter [Sulfurospirillum diekertiae]